MRCIGAVARASFVGAIVGSLAAGATEALIGALSVMVAGIVHHRVLEGVLGAVGGSLYFFAVGAMDGWWLGAVIGGGSRLVCARRLLRSLVGAVAGAAAGLFLVWRANSSNSGVLWPPPLVVAMSIAATAAAGGASAVVGGTK